MSDHSVNRSPSPSSRLTLSAARSRSLSRKSLDSAQQSSSRLAGSAHSSPQRHPSKTDRSRKRSISTTHRPKSESVRRAFIGLIKTYIRKETNKAQGILQESRRAIGIFTDPNTDLTNMRPAVLHKVHKVFQRLERATYRVEQLPTYIVRRFGNPEIQRSQEKNTFADEVLSVLIEQDTDKLVKQLKIAVSILMDRLLDQRYPIVQFVPDDSEVANGIQSEDSEIDTDNDYDDIPTAPIMSKDNREPVRSNLPIAQVAFRDDSDKHPSQDVPTEILDSLSYYEKAAKVFRTENARLEDEIRRMKMCADSRENREQETQKRMDLEAELISLRTAFELQQKLARESVTPATSIGASTANTSATVIPGTSTNIALATAPLAHKPTVVKTSPSATDTLIMNMHNLMHTFAAQQQKAVAEVTNMKRQMTHENAKSIEVMEHLMTKKLNEHVAALMARIEDVEGSKSLEDADEALVREYENQGLDDAGEEENEPVAPLTDTPSSTTAHTHLRPNNRSHPPDDRSHNRPCDDKQLSLAAEIKHIKVFDGTGNYDLFKATYLDSVLNRDAVGPVQKYAILTDKLAGDAATCLASLLSPETSVAQTLINLDEIYGNQNDKYNLIAKLNQLRFHQTDPVRMRLDVISHQSVLAQLRAKGMAPNDDRVTMALVAKLPPAMRSKISEYMTEIGDTVTFDQIFTRVKGFIKSLEMDNFIMNNYQASPRLQNEISETFGSVNYANASINQQEKKQSNVKPSKKPSTLAYDPAKYRSTYYDSVTRTNLDGIFAPGTGGLNLALIYRSFPYTNEEDVTCNACGGSHHAMRCPLTSTEFRKAAKSKGLCPLCNNKHTLESCRSQLRCGYCDGLHHMGGCPKKEFYRDPKNYPKEARAVTTLFRKAKSNNKKK